MRSLIEVCSDIAASLVTIVLCDRVNRTLDNLAVTAFTNEIDRELHVRLTEWAA